MCYYDAGTEKITGKLIDSRRTRRLAKAKPFRDSAISAARVENRVESCEFYLHGDPHPHFSFLSLNAQDLFLTGQPTYPVERTLLVSGALEALLDSRHRGHVRIETPHLDVSYRSFSERPRRAMLERPTGPATVPWRPERA